jgi:hypothetical protein
MDCLNQIYDVSAYNKFSNKTIFTSDIGSAVYGEATKEGIENLLKYFKNHFNKETVFYDLGCGLGKIVAHIGLMNVKKSVGIEYSKERYEGCCYIKDTCCPDYNNIEYYNKSYLDYDFSDATVIYIDNTCCSEKVNKILYDKVPKNCLYIFKSKYKLLNNNLVKEKVQYEENLVNRTYGQNEIAWLVKQTEGIVETHEPKSKRVNKKKIQVQPIEPKITPKRVLKITAKIEKVPEPIIKPTEPVVVEEAKPKKIVKKKLKTKKLLKKKLK